MKFPVPDGDHHDPTIVYVHQASHTRGVLINQIILLERLIDSYISKYFCNTQDKATELMDMILATRRMTFDGKAEVFRAILDKLYPEKKKENSTIAKDLKFIIEERNMLAHYFLDVSPDILNSFSETNSAFTLLKIEKTRTREVFDFKRIIKIGDTTVHYINAINEMLEKTCFDLDRTYNRRQQRTAYNIGFLLCWLTNIYIHRPVRLSSVVRAERIKLNNGI